MPWVARPGHISRAQAGLSPCTGCSHGRAHALGLLVVLRSHGDPQGKQRSPLPMPVPSSPWCDAGGEHGASCTLICPECSWSIARLSQQPEAPSQTRLTRSGTPPRPSLLLQRPRRPGSGCRLGGISGEELRPAPRNLIAWKKSRQEGGPCQALILSAAGRGAACCWPSRAGHCFPTELWAPLVLPHERFDRAHTGRCTCRSPRSHP